MRAERHFLERPGTYDSLESLVATVDKHSGFGNVLIDRSRMEGTVTCAWFVEAAARNNICQDRGLSEFALRLASDEPLDFAEVAGDPRLDPLLAKLIVAPSILRAARLRTLILRSASEGSTEGAPPSRFPT